MGRIVKLLLLSLSVLIFFYVALGYVLGKTTDDRAYRPLTVFSEVLQHIQQDYVEEPNLPLVTSGALHGLLESLDAQSSYFTPREYAEYKKQLEHPPRAAIGVALSKRFGYVVVVSALPDSPAVKAGLRSGDILEAIAGFTTREMSIGQAQMLLNGAPGTPVKLSVIRRGRAEPLPVEVIRAEPLLRRLGQEKLADAEAGIVYLRVPSLPAGRAEEVRQRLAQFERQGLRKLVLDLRDCASGEVSEAVAVARLFLPSGTITSLRGQTVAPQEFAADAAKVAWNHPLTLLISSGTSGPAEVLAAAIADNKRGDTLGERTFGTASEQKLIPLDDGAALVLTVAKYYTPSGKSIPEEGVAPTVPAEGRGDLGAVDEDEGLAQPPSAPTPRGEDDPVLKKAIELLKGPAAKKAAALRAPRATGSWASAGA